MKRSLNVPDYVVRLARELRKNQTESEKILWEALRNKRFMGLKFRRQQPVGRYIIDFLCMEKKLVIEVDGLVHKDSVEYDSIKDLYLQGAGFKVLRIPADTVENNFESALKMIKEILLLE